MVHQVIKDTLLFRYDLDDLSQEVAGILLDSYVKDICDVFRGHSRSIKVLKQVAIQLFFLVLESVQKLETATQSSIQVHALGKNRRYKRGKQLFLDNPLRSGSQEEMSRLVDHPEPQPHLSHLSDT